MSNVETHSSVRSMTTARFASSVVRRQAAAQVPSCIAAASASSCATNCDQPSHVLHKDQRLQAGHLHHSDRGSPCQEGPVLQCPWTPQQIGARHLGPAAAGFGGSRQGSGQRRHLYRRHRRFLHSAASCWDAEGVMRSKLPHGCGNHGISTPGQRSRPAAVTEMRLHRLLADAHWRKLSADTIRNDVLAAIMTRPCCPI